MKHIISLLFLAAVITISKADSTQNLLQKFKTIQQTSQTYKDYKVIKMQLLNSWTNEIDHFLSSQNESIKKLQEENLQLKKQLELFQNDLAATKANLKNQEIVQTHVSFAGFDVHKNTWLIFCGIMISAAIAAVSFFVIRNQVLAVKLSHKKQELLGVSSEYENLKQRSLEKQMKLSRELQNERNKLEQLKLEMRQSF
ncbi:MAG: hypothetical protein O9340_06990 [Cyclobacteriaceae bacterium]|jgi:hypothetical protein|nr:hypothetical protein [Cyclobacteriaceae bacterium]